MKVKGESIFIALLMIVFLLYLVESLGYNETARFSPLIVGVPLLVLLAFQLAVTMRRKEQNEDQVDQALERVKNRRILGLVAASASIIALSYFFGLLPVMALSLVLYFLLYVKLRPVISLMIGALTWGILHFVFVKLFSIPLPVGTVVKQLL